MSAPRTSLAEAEDFLRGPRLADALTDLARDAPERVYLRERGREVTTADLAREVERTAEALRAQGVTATSRVAIALPVSVEHVALIFAVLRIGALWIPLNPQLKGEPLAHQMRDSGATHVVAAPLSPLGEELSEGLLPLGSEAGSGDDARLFAVADAPVSADEERREASLLMYTSGTTGPPKGALVTETMLRAAVLGAIEVTAPEPGDVFYVWEPLFHIGGAQVVFLPLFRDVALALAPRFSASRFWRDVVDFDVTHIHYLGGVLQILLQLPPDEAERANRVRVAWGAGATPEVRAACRERYRFALHECYGMTETSSIVTVNRDEVDGGVGEPLPWVDVAVSDAREVLVRGRVPGLLTPGYLGNPAATEKAREGDWFRTGDLGRLDDRGRLHFTGRGSDSIRVRGENVSAWQVESVFGLHPDVDRCAVVGVDAEVGEQEMLLLLTAAEGRHPDPSEVLSWGAERLAPFQLPRYARIVEEMPLTPSQRIAKHRLPRDVDGAAERPRPARR
ncbi:class I adenylate-forming enzyme family protein [Microbacterium sp. gxy059]|uniref:class I adenylate-forming enzyme family protein n=1 Tax=Microbacterium sp. gxy059 TaxID=2957199 RepID=UPI003D981A6F